VSDLLIEATVRYGTDMGDLLPGGIHEPDVDVIGPAGTTVHYEGMMEFRALDIAPVLEFLMDVGKDAPAALIAAWLIAKFAGRVGKVTINHREINLDDEGQVRRIVEDEITIED
jgi:hypothetical protein